MQIEIRQLGTSDAVEYRDLRLRGLREVPEAFGSTYDEEVLFSLDTVETRLESTRSPTGRVILGAFADAVLVGIVGCAQESRFKKRHTAVIFGMYVAPEVRSHGIGRRLLNESITEARTWPNVERMTITVVERVRAARALYVSLGFEPFGREVDALRENGVRDVMEYLALPLTSLRRSDPSAK